LSWTEEGKTSSDYEARLQKQSNILFSSLLLAFIMSNSRWMRRHRSSRFRRNRGNDEVNKLLSRGARCETTPNLARRCARNGIENCSGRTGFDYRLGGDNLIE
jgi:hypothetical protein